MTRKLIKGVTLEPLVGVIRAVDAIVRHELLWGLELVVTASRAWAKGWDGGAGTSAIQQKKKKQ